MSKTSAGAAASTSHVTKTFPLNSRRLTAETLSRIAKALDLPTTASADETRQLIEGKLGEETEPRNVQVDMVEDAAGKVGIQLRSEEGVIVDIPLEERVTDEARETHEEELEAEEGEDVGGASHLEDVAVTSLREEKLTARAADAEAEAAAARDRILELETELERITEDRRLREEELAAEVSELSERVREEKEKYRILGRMNCDHLLEYDEALARKYEENELLRERVRELELEGKSMVPSSHVRSTGVTAPAATEGGGGTREAVVPVSDPGRSPGRPPLSGTPREGHPPPVQSRGGARRPALSRTEPALPRGASDTADRSRVRELHCGSSYDDPTPESHVPRRGRAPPVDSFDGESDVLFEDWMPALLRAAEWYSWSKHETLILLAGHLRGRAMQEWGLLTPAEKDSLDAASSAMRSRLDPSSRALAAQDFRHASQQESESVADFIRRLEQLFKLAYGRDGMSDETRGMLLHSQLQEGLRYEIMKAPAVSGSQGYKELCLASRNEEKRLAELAKRRQFSKTPRSLAVKAQQNDQSLKNTPVQKPPSDSSGSQKQQLRGENRSVTQRRCYSCGGTGHISRDCPSRQDGNASPQRPRTAGTKQVSTTSPGTPQLPSPTPQLLTQLLSSSDSGSESEGVRLVRVNDGGSRQRYAEVIMEGVPAVGVVDTGAEITIINAKLFTWIAAVAHLKKS